jgi:hypothetical protein
MQTLITLISLLLMPVLLLQAGDAKPFAGDKIEAQGAPAAKQLLAVRGTIISIKTPAKGELQLIVKPPKEFPEVSLLARQKDLVGSAARRTSDGAGLSLLGGSANENEIITAAELSEGDIVSVIYDPQMQNRALEIYLH